MGKYDEINARAAARDKQKAVVADMKSAVEKTFASLGAKISFDADKALGGYKRGEIYTVAELREVPLNTVVWVRWKEYEEEAPRDDGPFRVNSKNKDGWGFENGSSFAHDLCEVELNENKLKATHALRVDKCGVGLFEVFRAIK